MDIEVRDFGVRIDSLKYVNACTIVDSDSESSDEYRGIFKFLIGENYFGNLLGSWDSGQGGHQTQASWGSGEAQGAHAVEITFMCQIIGNWGFYEEDSEFLLPWLEANATKFFEVLYFALVANSDWIHCRIEALWMVNNWMCNSAAVIGFFVAQETILDKILFSIPKYPNYQLCKESIPIIESFTDKCSD